MATASRATRAQRVFLPLTAPGDMVRARLGERRGEGRSAEVLGFEAQAARAAPRCPHFGACGGCALQHLPPAAYVEAKTGWLAAALRHHGLEAEIKPLRLLPPGTRRRARFAMARPRAAKSRRWKSVSWGAPATASSICKAARCCIRR